MQTDAEPPMPSPLHPLSQARPRRATATIAPRTSWLTLSLAIGLQACSSGYEKNNNELHEATNQRMQQAQALARQSRAPTPLVMEEKAVRFSTRSVPLVRSSMLPGQIEQVTVRYPGRHNLGTIADILTRTLGVVVHMTPDALMDPQAFIPGRAQAAPLVPPPTPTPSSQSPPRPCRQARHG